MKVATQGKRGRIIKNAFVFSNDPEKPTVSLALLMNVTDPYHAKKYEPREIFKQPCAECHVDRGRGKTGAALFNAVCLICHRAAKSNSNFAKFRNMPEEAIRSAVYSGVSGTSMPGFSWKDGGVLADEEIDSIIKYIKNR
jgi:mono/diheme cytochrome c family protein